MKRGILIALIALVAVSFVTLSYYIMHNTMVISMVIADDRITASDGRGQYSPGVDGVVLGHFFTGPGVSGGPFGIDMTDSTRSVYVSFYQAYWRDANLRDIPSILPSKNYRMILWITAFSDGYPVDVFDMEVGKRYLEPELSMVIAFYDVDTGELAGLNTKHPAGNFFYGLLNVWINSTTPEPPQSLLEEGYIIFERVDEEGWVLDVNAWFVSYHRLFGGEFWKYYVKLSLELTTIRRPML